MNHVSVVDLLAGAGVVIADVVAGGIGDARRHGELARGRQMRMLAVPVAALGIVGPAAIHQGLPNLRHARLVGHRGFSAGRRNRRRGAGGAHGQDRERQNRRNENLFHLKSPLRVKKERLLSLTLPRKHSVRQISYDTGNHPVALRLVATEWVSGSPRPVSQTSFKL